MTQTFRDRLRYQITDLFRGHREVGHVVLDPDVYLTASKIINDERIRCCFAIRLATDVGEQYIEPFRELFYPEEENGMFWFTDHELSGDENRDRRVLALLLMAEMVRNGDV